MALFEGIRPESYLFLEFASWFTNVCMAIYVMFILAIPLILLGLVLKGIVGLWNLLHS